MKDRIIELRKKLGLTQTEFGARIGLTRDGVASYERGVAKPTGTAIQCMILTYNVRREWLETGEGEMFSGGRIDYLSKLAAENNLGPNQKALLSVAMEALQSLDDASCEILLDRLFAKLMEIKEENNLKAASAVSSIIPADSPDSSIMHPEAAAK